MANKPTFTFMDYKQRIHDELDNLKSSILYSSIRYPQENESRSQGCRKGTLFVKKDNECSL